MCNKPYVSSKLRHLNRKSKVRVHMSKYGRRYVMDFNDWWDFADYVKQQQLDCHVTCVVGWEYVDAQAS